MAILDEGVSECIGSSIVGLSFIAEDAAHGAEKHEEVQLCSLKGMMEVPGAFNLWSNSSPPFLDAHVEERLVSQDHRHL
jgi:hypothetical protein